jgi:hypothetical protein
VAVIAGLGCRVLWALGGRVQPTGGLLGRCGVNRAKGARTKGPLLITSTGQRLTRQHAGKLIKRVGEQIGNTPTRCATAS